MEQRSPGAWVVDLIQRSMTRSPVVADDQRGHLADVVHLQSGAYLEAMGAEVHAALVTAATLVDTSLGCYRPRTVRRKVTGFSVYRESSRDAWHLYHPSPYDTSLQLRTEIAGRVEVRHVPFVLDGDTLALQVAGELLAPPAAAQRLFAPFLRFVITRA